MDQTSNYVKKTQNTESHAARATDERHIPPHNLEAERSVLGALLLDANSYHKVIDIGLQAEDFYRDAHGKIFQTIQELHYKNEPVDAITLSNALKDKAIYDNVGGLSAVTALFEESYSSAHVSYYAKIIKEKAILRRVITTANDLVMRAYDGVEDVGEYLDLAEKSIFDVTDTKLQNSFVDIKQVLHENMNMIQELSEKKLSITGLATGFSDLDEKTSGLQPGQLIVIAGRPAMGKTSFALNIAENSALQSKSSVAVFSLEMSKEELGFRFLTSLAKVDASRLKVGRLQDKDWKSLAKAAGQLSEAKLFIDDSPALSVLEMRARCRRLQSEHGLSLVIVDYLQLMKGNSKGGKMQDSREREISEISRSLKALAKELRVPIIALSQLNRSLESRPDKRPMLSDLRESGAIEQDADIVAFVYRDEVYNRDTIDKGVAEIIIAKHRAGSVGTVRLSWLSEYTAFSNYVSEQYGVNPYAHDETQYSNAEAQFFGGDAANKSDQHQPSGASVRSRKGSLDLPNF